MIICHIFELTKWEARIVAGVCFLRPALCQVGVHFERINSVSRNLLAHRQRKVNTRISINRSAGVYPGKIDLNNPVLNKLKKPLMLYKD